MTALPVDDARLVVGHGAEVSVVPLAGAGVVERGDGGGDGIKGVAFAAHGIAYAGSADGHLRAFAPPPWLGADALPFPGSPARRYLVAGAGRWLVATSYGRGIFAAPIDALGDGGATLELAADDDLHGYWRDLDESSDGRYVAGLRDGVITLLDFGTGGPPTSERLGDDPRAEAIAPWSDGALIAAAGGDLVIVWRRDPWSATAGLIAPGATLLEVAVDPSGRFVAAGGREGAVYVWDLAQEAPVRPVSITGAFDLRVAALTWSRDGVLHAGSWDGRVRHLSLAPLLRTATQLARDVERRWDRAP